MRVFRWLELTSGVAAGVCGGGGVWYFLTAPLGMLCRDTGGQNRTCVPVSYLESTFTADTAWLVVILCILFGWITLVAILDSLGVWRARRWLWMSTIVLAGVTLLGSLTIGLFLLPGLGLSLLTALLASMKRFPPHPTTPRDVTMGGS